MDSAEHFQVTAWATQQQLHHNYFNKLPWWSSFSWQRHPSHESDRHASNGSLIVDFLLHRSNIISDVQITIYECLNNIYHSIFHPCLLRFRYQFVQVLVHGGVAEWAVLFILQPHYFSHHQHMICQRFHIKLLQIICEFLKSYFWTMTASLRRLLFFIRVVGFSALIWFLLCLCLTRVRFNCLLLFHFHLLFRFRYWFLQCRGPRWAISAAWAWAAWWFTSGTDVLLHFFRGIHVRSRILFWSVRMLGLLCLLVWGLLLVVLCHFEFISICRPWHFYIFYNF